MTGCCSSSAEVSHVRYSSSSRSPDNQLKPRKNKENKGNGKNFMPVKAKKRSCTDCLCCLGFMLVIGLFVVISMFAFINLRLEISDFRDPTG